MRMQPRRISAGKGDRSYPLRPGPEKDREERGDTAWRTGIGNRSGRKQAMKQDQYDIFISYRRDGGSGSAKHLRDILHEKGYRVFFDNDSLRNGSFNQQLIDIIRDCSDFILILSPNALDRCVNEGDWVRQEVAAALKYGKNIVPVFTEGFSFPETLPEDIDGIRWKNGITVNYDYFDAVVTKLISFLQSRPHRRGAPRWLIPACALGAAAVIALAVLLLRPWQPKNELASQLQDALTDMQEEGEASNLLDDGTEETEVPANLQEEQAAALLSGETVSLNGGAEETDAVTNLKEKGPAVSLLGGEDVRLGVEPEGTDLSSVFTGTDQGIFKTYGQTKEENQP